MAQHDEQQISSGAESSQVRERDRQLADNARAERPAPIERASGGQANADLAAERAPADLQPGEDLSARQEQLLDEAVEETFPASDPISPKLID